MAFRLWDESTPENMWIEVSRLIPNDGGKIGMRSRYFKPSEAQAAINGCHGLENSFFGVALRKSPGREAKDAGPSNLVWVDWDDTTFPTKRLVLPCTYAIRTVHGFHIYWRLSKYVEPEMFEALNKIMIESAGTFADSCWYRNSRGRIPGSLHDGVEMKLVLDIPVVYAPEDIKSLAEVDSKLFHKVITGDSRGYTSRSEFDLAVIAGLCRCGFSRGAIETIYDYHKCGEKMREHPDPKHYFNITYEKASANVLVVRGPEGFQVRERETWVRNGSNLVKVATFSLRVLKVYHVDEGIDALNCEVMSPGFPQVNHTLTRSAFNSVRQLLAELPRSHWQWYGNDGDVRKYLSFLVNPGLLHVNATTTAGLHDGCIVLPGLTIGPTEVWEGNGPVEYISGPMKAPTINHNGYPVVKDLLTPFMELNIPCVMYPVLGWWFASTFKPMLESVGYRFPILNVFGTQGCGKTTLVSALMRLWGYENPMIYDSTTTRFVLLSLLGSTNNLPVALAEFRSAKASEYLLRYVRLMYDLGADPRGRPDQTVESYQLTAPVAIDGEDALSEPAALERVVGVRLNKVDIQPGTKHHTTYQHFLTLHTGGLSIAYFQWALSKKKDTVREILDSWTQALVAAYPTLPHRVRNNFVVVLFGLEMLHDFSMIEFDESWIDVLKPSIVHSFDLEAGRNKMHVDDLVVSLVGSVAQGMSREVFTLYDKQVNVLWFHFGTAASWYEVIMKRRGLVTLGRDALASQLEEAEYIVGRSIIESRWCYGIDLAKAVDSGLDIPSKLDIARIVIDI